MGTWNRWAIGVMAGLGLGMGLTAHAADDDPALCPAMFREASTVLGLFNAMGQNVQVATLCKVTPSQVSEYEKTFRASMRPCVRMFGIKPAELDAARAEGAAFGTRIYTSSGAKPQLCEAARDGLTP